MKRYVVLSDIQIPYQDPRALALAIDFTLDLAPDGVILNGDVVDCYALSSFDKAPMTTATLARELRESAALMARLAPIPHKVWIGGNHEDRLRRYIWKNAPALGLLPQLEFEHLFHLADHGFTWHDYGMGIGLGKLYVTHGTMVRAHSGATARAHLERLGQSVLIGHTHRLGAYYHTTMAGPQVAYENGCLCRLTPEYVKHPNWQQGFSVVDVFPGGRFNVQQLPILKRRECFWGGARWVAGESRATP